VESDCIPSVLMGSGLMIYKSKGTINNTARKIISEGVQLGFDNPSNRQSVFEIMEVCEREIPKFLQPDFHTVENCISDLVSKNGKKSEGESNAATHTRSKSLARNRQEKVGTLSREHHIKLLDPSKGYLFKAKYLGSMLLDDINRPRKFLSVNFDENMLTREGGWYVMASLAQEKPSDDRVYTVDVATGDAIRFNCSQLSKYVKK